LKKIIQKVFPININNDYKGYKIAVYMFMLYSLVSIVRSCIHFFSADAGVGIIAHLDLSQGGQNIIFFAALWGSGQLILAFMQVLVVFRYRTLLPFMYILLFLEYCLRAIAGIMRSPIFQVGAGTPPGGYLNLIMIPLTIIMLILTLLERKKRTDKQLQS